VVLFTYDPRGTNLAKATLPSADKTDQALTETYDYYPRYWLASTTYAGPGAPTYKVAHEYDKAGNRRSTTDERNQRTEFRYDEANRLIEEIMPAGNHRFYAYDLLGRKIMFRDGNGNETRYEYNVLDKLSGHGRTGQDDQVWLRPGGESDLRH